MNSRITALQHLCVAGAMVGALLGVGARPSLAQGGAPRAHTGTPSGAPRTHAASRAHAATASRTHAAVRAHASIVDGASASIAEFPFQVALYDPRMGSPAKGFFCGGVILGATRVATAAHCLIGERGRRSPPGEIEVLAGSSDLDPLAPGSVRDPVAAASVDPAYNAASSDYDVGLLHLARPLWSGAAPALDGHSTIAPLALDASLANLRSAAVLAGTATALQATVSGWGDLNAEPGPSPSYPLHLHQARVPLIASAFCEEAYATIEQPITPRMLCAGSRTDSCYGDSGGPLIAPGAGGPAGDALLGLVDFGNGCGQAGYPGVYVRIADPAVASFLGAGTAQSSSLSAHRSLCARRAPHRRSAGGPGPRHGRRRCRR